MGLSLFGYFKRSLLLTSSPLWREEARKETLAGEVRNLSASRIPLVLSTFTGMVDFRTS